MKHPLIRRGVPSALFVFKKSDVGHQLLRGYSGSAPLIGASVAALQKHGLIASDWVYVDSLMKQEGYVASSNLFHAPISCSQSDLVTDPATFFGERNPPGIVVAPFSAITLGAAIKDIVVLREGEFPICVDDVMRSLKAYYTSHDRQASPVLLEDAVRKMAIRITSGSTIDRGTITVLGSKLYMSTNWRNGYGE